ncbi:hypothetical protein DL96DRAFT_1562848 [Flagelloscypha sp. PMI_526]|nr:hypothetical protein DL96DRAFT_1562848 [Flagelloscypha sp. PMI_526]
MSSNVAASLRDFGCLQGVQRWAGWTTQIAERHFERSIAAVGEVLQRRQAAHVEYSSRYGGNPSKWLRFQNWNFRDFSPTYNFGLRLRRKEDAMDFARKHLLGRIRVPPTFLQTAISLDGTILLECHWYLTPKPQSLGKFHILIALPPENKHGIEILTTAGFVQTQGREKKLTNVTQRRRKLYNSVGTMENWKRSTTSNFKNIDYEWSTPSGS